MNWRKSAFFVAWFGGSQAHSSSAASKPHQTEAHKTQVGSAARPNDVNQNEAYKTEEFAKYQAGDSSIKKNNAMTDSCGICTGLRMRLLQDEDSFLSFCEKFGICHLFPKDEVMKGCGTWAHCPKDFTPWDGLTKIEPHLDLRVSKGYGTRGYNSIRVSAVTRDPSFTSDLSFDLHEQFTHRWKQASYLTGLKEVDHGTWQAEIRGQKVRVDLPAKGAGVTGVLIADPCIESGWAKCYYSDVFQTSTRIQDLLNLFVPQMDFYAILGDNAYDMSGEFSANFFDGLSLDVKQKFFMTVAGNHDYWVLGSPWLRWMYPGHMEQYGNGFMQYTMMDTRAAKDKHSNETPFDFSVNPNDDSWEKSLFKWQKVQTKLRGPVAQIDNSFWYHQLGNVGFIGFSGVFELEETFWGSSAELPPLLKEACAWLGEQDQMDVAVLLGHWDGTVPDPLDILGSVEATTPNVYRTISKYPGCDKFDQKGRLKFVTGHVHCNMVHPEFPGTGFMVSGQGMSDGTCSPNNFGVPVLDSTEDHIRMYYFKIAEVAKPRDTVPTFDNYDEVYTCVSEKGWRKCLEYADVWLDEPLGNTEL